MKKYDSYKDSGNEFIDRIPQHWEALRLKNIGAFTSSGIDKKKKKNESDIKIINYTDVYGNKNFTINSSFNFMIVTEKKSKIFEHQVNKGDLIFTPSSEDKNEIGISALVTEELDNTAYSYHVLRFKFKKYIDLKFKKYLCNNHYVLSYFSKNAQGTTRQTLGRNDFNNADVVIPPLKEQTTIADYLDRKTAEIDELIADKKRLLELYEEEKTAIINELVTGKKVWNGYDWVQPTQDKDSGVEWLGDIPAHWEVKKVKHVVLKVGSGVTPSGGASVYKLTGIPLLRSQNIHFDGLRLDDVAYITDEIHEKMSNSRVYTGDVLLNITGASMGRAFYVEKQLGEANVNQHVCILRPKKNIKTRYLYFILRSIIGQEQIRIEQTGSGREGLNFESLKNFIIPFVNTQEQQNISDHIESEIKQINLQINQTKKLIDLLTEYRQALISEVVTGKVKVTE